MQNTTRIVFHGIVKPAQTIQMPNSLNPISVATRCQFEMMLKPGQNHIEARMVGTVRQTTVKNARLISMSGFPPSSNRRRCLSNYARALIAYYAVLKYHYGCRGHD